jgi:hypothetical protein
VDLAPEFPVLDGDSGKTAGVVIFLQTAREPDPSPILSAPEAGGSPRKSGSLPNNVVTLLQIA